MLICNGISIWLKQIIYKMMQRYIAQEMIRAWEFFFPNIQMSPDEETFGGVFMIYGLITSILIHPQFC